MKSTLKILAFLFSLSLNLKSQATYLNEENFDNSNKIAYYINLRDFLDPCASVSLGMQIPHQNKNLIDLQLGFINPFTSLFGTRAMESIINYDELNNIQLNNYGLKISSEYKITNSLNSEKIKFHGLQLNYQYELSQGEVKYRRQNSFDQYIDTDWSFHTLGLYYKYGFIINSSKDNVFVEVAFGGGMEYLRDVNSALKQYPDAEFPQRREFFFSESIPKPGTIFPELAAIAVEFGNTYAVLPNLVFSLKLGFRK